MNNISSEYMWDNLSKVYSQYQEILLYFMQGKINLLPEKLANPEINKNIITQLLQQFYKEPEKLVSLQVSYVEELSNLIANSVIKFTGHQPHSIFSPKKNDKRFKDSMWQENVFFDFVKQYYLMLDSYSEKVINQYKLDDESWKYLQFCTKQFMNAISPTNSIFYNPEVLKEGLESGWANVARGLEKLLNDIKSSQEVFNMPIVDSQAFKLGTNIATSKGKVLLRNELIELICYEPKNSMSYSIPLLIIPPCINKYYILDLSPDNSFISFLLENNIQPFIISWKNPDSKLADKSFADYIEKAIKESCEYIINTFNYPKINMLGYCIGGTMAAIATSYIQNKNLNYVNSLSFLTTLLDFSEPGEIGIFINEASISTIEKEMQSKGYLDGRYLSNSFSLLRSNDLIWSFFIHNYLLGKTPLAFDILYWNADHTNLSASMHSYYLRNMYLNNLLKVPNALEIDGIPVNIAKINCPSFFLAAQNDHIAPWDSVYNSSKLINGSNEFVLTSAGHVAGVVNPPRDCKNSYRINNKLYDTGIEWFDTSQEVKGSWWEYWIKWLHTHSDTLTPSIDYSNLEYITLAPGEYVYNR